MKNDNFSLMTSGAKTIELMSNLSENVTGASRELSNVFFEFLLAITLFEILANVCEKSLFFQNLTFDDLW